MNKLAKQLSMSLLVGTIGIYCGSGLFAAQQKTTQNPTKVLTNTDFLVASSNTLPVETSAKDKPSDNANKAKEVKLSPEEYAIYMKTIASTANMVGDGKAQQLVSKYGLSISNITWEDTGRYKGSSVGPNISDMTIQVAARDPRTKRNSVTCMPVIRYDSFSDKTCDIDPRDFTLLVGNQKGKDLKRISLYDFLEKPTTYLTNPGSWKSESKSLLAARDSKVLVSAQACFLPISKQGKATFNPVLFNYQSYKDNPAVLTVLVTREGTSVTVIDNTRDAFESGSVWGQRLFHNDNGQRASLTGERESDFLQSNIPNNQGPSVGSELKTNPENGLNMVLLIQIPLKQKEHPVRDLEYSLAGTMSKAEAVPPPASNVENAVISHGEVEGPFTEIDNLKIERDDRFPVRVTVQFYKATSNGVVSEEDIKSIKNQIERVYSQSDYVGSLVVDGDTNRVTEYDGVKVQPANWWEEFWQRHEKNTGDKKDVAIAKLRALLGSNYQHRPVNELYLHNLLKKSTK